MHSLQLLSVGLTAFMPALAAQNTISSDPCAQLAAFQSQEIKKGAPWLRVNDIGQIKMNAEMAYNCTISVPLVADHALTALSYLKSYSDFDTTISFLKNPPKSYQKLGVDVNARLDQLADNIKNKKYKNQYEMELDLAAINRDAAEGHFSMNLKLHGLFQWSLNDTIISLSRDGKELPQIYAMSDIFKNISNPSPIVQIGGKPAFEYLRNYLERASPLSSFSDVNADWNVMVFNTAWNFGSWGTGVLSSWANGGFQQTSVYNGKSLQMQFANGSTSEWLYSASSTADLGSWDATSGTKIYNAIVANLKVVSGVKSRSDKSIDLKDSEPFTLGVRQQQTAPALKPYTCVPMWNYPKNPNTIENNFGMGGIVSGYILKDDSVGVLSLPSYDRGSDAKTGTTAENYTDAVQDFINVAQKNKVKKIVIDLSGNGGGSTMLGYAVFKLFFPSIEPTLLGRARATPYINTMGSFITGVLENKDGAVAQNIAQTVYNKFAGVIGLTSFRYLDADGHEFKSWKDFFGPRKNNGDSFTNGIKYNLSSNSVTGDLHFVMPGYDPTVKPTQSELWAAEDIILLHDGYCASTCAIFSELMKTDAGVKSVAVGGVPEYGPMQGVAGTRGSLKQDFEFYNNTAAYIREVVASAGNKASSILKLWGLTLDDIRALPLPLSTSPLVISGSANALDMIRASNLDTPLQFTYQASDCRLFYTFDMARDVTALWRAAGKVAGGDYSACVQGSTKAPGSSQNATILSDPGYSYNSTWSRVNSTSVPDNKGSDGNGGGNDDSGAAGLSAGFSGILAITLTAVLMF